MIENISTLLMLILLQVVLGFDNLLYISIESQRAPKDKQDFVRKIGIIIAIVLRIVLLFVVIRLIQSLQTPFFSINLKGILGGEFNFHSLVVLTGGVFIIYTALKEISHMMMIDELGHDELKQNPRKSSVVRSIALIVMMNLVFSFDSILSALVLTDVFWVMAGAIVVNGIMMIWLAKGVSDFLERNRMYEVLGLFILLIVGVMLLSEGGHLAHLHFFGYVIEPMAKSTFYFVIFIIVVVEMVQGRYQKKLLREFDSTTEKI